MPLTESKVLLREDSQLLMIGVENSYADDATPGPVQAILGEDVDVTVERKTEQSNESRGFLGAGSTATIHSHVNVSLTVKLGGSKDGTATTPPPYNDLYLGCSLAGVVEADRVAYNIVGKGKSLSIYYMIEDELHKIVGCIGDAEFVLGTDAMPRLKLTLKGLYLTPGTGTRPDPADIDYTGWGNPLAPNSKNIQRVEYFGHKLRMSELTLKMGVGLVYANVAYQEFVDGPTREGSVSITFIADDLATINFYELADRNASSELNYQLGDMATNVGHVFGLNIPNLQIKDIKKTFKDKIKYFQLDCAIVPLTANSDFNFFHA